MPPPNFSTAAAIAKYRLAPRDVPRKPVEAKITKVTVVGLEQLTVLLSLDRFAKPLTIDQAQIQRLTDVTGSATFQDWVGYTVSLHRSSADGIDSIAVEPLLARPPDSTSHPHTPRLSARLAESPSSSTFTLIILLLVLGFALAVVFAVENSSILGNLFTR